VGFSSGDAALVCSKPTSAALAQRHSPLKAETGVQFPVGAPTVFCFIRITYAEIADS
jgi:hypothetical protein